MKCIISGQNAAVLARAVNSFARIGNEIFLEGSNNGLSIRTVNSTKSAFAMILFQPAFFIEFNIADSEDILSNMCKLSLKSLLGVFKNMRLVESCEITLDLETHKFIIQLKCRLETVKTHYVNILEQETLQACYIKDKVPNVLVASHKLFTEIVSNFKVNEEELTLEVNEGNIVAKNYLEGSYVDSRFVRSQLSLRPEEFEGYQISDDTSITFCMRELRAFLNLAEALNVDMSLHFEAAGKPIVFILKDIDIFEANLVMATLTPDAVASQCRSNRPVAETTANRQNITTSTSAGSQSTSGIPSVRPTKMAKHPKTIGKRNRTVTPPDVVRNLATNNDDNDDDDIGLFQFDQPTESPFAGLEKRRKTTTLPTVIDTPNTDSAPAFSTSNTDNAAAFNIRNDDLLPDRNDGDPVNVIFAEDSLNTDLNESLSHERQRKRRDHGVCVRNALYDLCLNSPESFSYGAVINECSDEE